MVVANRLDDRALRHRPAHRRETRAGPDANDPARSQRALRVDISVSISVSTSESNSPNSKRRTSVPRSRADRTSPLAASKIHTKSLNESGTHPLVAEPERLDVLGCDRHAHLAGDVARLDPRGQRSGIEGCEPAGLIGGRVLEAHHDGAWSRIRRFIGSAARAELACNAITRTAARYERASVDGHDLHRERPSDDPHFDPTRSRAESSVFVW